MSEKSALLSRKLGKRTTMAGQPLWKKLLNLMDSGPHLLINTLNLMFRSTVSRQFERTDNNQSEHKIVFRMRPKVFQGRH